MPLKYLKIYRELDWTGLTEQIFSQLWELLLLDYFEALITSSWLVAPFNYWDLCPLRMLDIAASTSKIEGLAPECLMWWLLICDKMLVNLQLAWAVDKLVLSDNRFRLSRYPLTNEAFP